ncbi:MAG: RpiB/LacA/LacB family sugar-phosphate isomerase [Bryobacteraceae bacterium]|nr:RpiB/LacA/LacB family sugar-phosphate isomerase [Bryobacteraceae bacterium]
MSKLPIAVGNDHGGYDLKLEIVTELEKLGMRVLDFGSNSREIVRYPHHAAKVCNAIQRGEASRGILIVRRESG